MNNRADLLAFFKTVLPDDAVLDTTDQLQVKTNPQTMQELATALTKRYGCEFATLVVEENEADFEVRYFFYARENAVLLQIITSTPFGTSIPAISNHVHAADWHEREAEDLFGIGFEGHPFLGDFVLHDTVWPEGVKPMRHQFDVSKRVQQPGDGANWQPWRLLDENGSIAFPVGPIWADYNEAGLWILETPGEQIHAGRSRLFFKYRAVEKIAEGRTVTDALLLAERFSGSAAFAHAWAYCQALEKIASSAVPPRAQALRIAFAELERMRYHAATIAELAGATALAVGKAIAQEIEEKLLRLTGEVCGHRYLYGLCVPGGFAWTLDERLLARLREGVKSILKEFDDLARTLIHTSSFLDRIEEMGTLQPDVARAYGVVGPVARASNRRIDLRRNLPYGNYENLAFAVPYETEGDGYARLRIYFAEIRESAALIESILTRLPTSPTVGAWTPCAGTALAWVEAPAGGTFHWLRLSADGRILRWRIAPPGFRNWHAFHRALEGAAFQDFHIIMASFGLSIAETDR